MSAPAAGLALFAYARARRAVRVLADWGGVIVTARKKPKDLVAPAVAVPNYAAPLTITLPPDVRELAALQREAEADAAALATLDVDTAAADVDAFLTDVVTRKDAALAMRKRVTGPAYQIAREVEGWFRPLVAALEGAERHLKGLLGKQRLAALAAEREARELAAAAAEAGDAETLLTALEVAAEAGARDDARATTRYAWIVKRIVEDLLPDEYWCPDAEKIGAVAKAADGAGDAPVIPGVVFERVAIVGARR